jgi:hypothetical protein
MPVDIAYKTMLMSVSTCCTTWTVISREVPGGWLVGKEGDRGSLRG